MDHIRRQYARNAVQLRTMLDKATRTGHTVNGFTADYLAGKVTIYTQLSTATDTQLRDHFVQCRVREAARLAELRASH